MYEAEVLFNDLSAVKSFVSVATKYEKLPINLISDVYTIDAHSLMGIISLDISKPMTLHVPVDDIPDTFFEDIKKYLAQPSV